MLCFSPSTRGICALSPGAAGRPRCPRPVQPQGRRPPSLPPPRPAPGPQAALAAPTPPGHRLQSGPSLPGDGYYLAVGGAAVQHNWSYILSVLQDRRFRCQLIDSSEDLGLISIQGPAR